MQHLYRNKIQQHMLTIPDLIIAQIRPMFFRSLEAVQSIRTDSIDKVILTGCGYSYAACLAARYQLRDILGMPVLALPAIEASRFSDTGLSRTLLIAISGSGAVSRVLEAMELYRRQGGTVVGLTENVEAPIRQYADVLIDVSSPDIGSRLPLRGYAMTLLALLALGKAISIKNTPRLLAEMLPMMDMLDLSMERMKDQISHMDEAAFHFAQEHRDLRQFEWIGAGYERAAAFLGKIQMMGQAGMFAIDEDPEQWLHCNFFMPNPEAIGTVLFLAKDSPAASRGREAMAYMRHLGRPLCVVTDDTALRSDNGMQVIHIPPVSAGNAGFLEMAVPSFLAGYYCDLAGETYSRGFRDRWSIFQDGQGTCQSEIVFL